MNTKNADYEKKIDKLLSELTLDEKLAMIHASSPFTSGGVERLGIPEIVMSDGPHGVRPEHGRSWAINPNRTDDFVSYLPTGIGLAATWNRNLGKQFGAVLGSEAKARGKDIILGPGMNIIRTPLNGRNFEYLSEDPYLAGEMAVGYIKGIQEQGIAACAKHFAANNQETERHNVDVYMSERALQEIYLPAFKKSVKEAGVYSVMGAYNKFRGEWCSHNNYLLNKILKEDWQFDGVLISDWGAVHDTRQALLNGLDLEMGTDIAQRPNINYIEFYLANPAKALIEKGEIDVAIVDDKVRRLLRLMYRTHLFDQRISGEVNTKAHQETARKVAEEGMVLLKNEGILPISKTVKTIAVIGDNATKKHAMLGGSSQVKTLYEVTPFEGIKNMAGTDYKILYAQGYESTRSGKTNMEMIKEAVEVAKTADMVILVGGWMHNFSNNDWGFDAYDSEGLDKKNIELPFGQKELIDALSEVNKNMAVVIMGGSQVEMLSWLDKAKALIQAWYPGMEGGNALAEILLGKINPSGKLPVTFANSFEEYPSHSIGEFPGKDLRVEYKEGIYVGYRYFDTKDIAPVFPFGYGLSYTTFEFSSLELQRHGDKVEVSFKLTNTGKVAGAEVAQVYIHADQSAVDRPTKELKQFDKVLLQPGETKQLSLLLSAEDFKYFDEIRNNWVLDSGDFTVMVGNSSRNLPLSAKVSW